MTKKYCGIIAEYFPDGKEIISFFPKDTKREFNNYFSNIQGDKYGRWNSEPKTRSKLIKLIENE